MNILQYKGYEGTAEIDVDRRVCCGKVLFVNDLVTYEADSPADLQREFEAAVEDYLDTCRELGREPTRPCKGLFNVRIPPSLHAEAIRRSLADGTTLNDVVVKALQAHLQPSTEVNHRHRVVITMDAPGAGVETLTTSPSGVLSLSRPYANY